MGRNLGKPITGVLKHMCRIAGVAEDLSALAVAIGKPYGTVKNWHARDRVPLSVIQEFAANRKVSVDRVLGGNSTHDESKNFGFGGLQVTEPGPNEQPINEARLLQQVVNEVLNALDRNNLSLPNDKVAQLVELIYDHERTRIGSAAAEEPRVRTTTERFLKLVAS